MQFYHAETIANTVASTCSVINIQSPSILSRRIELSCRQRKFVRTSKCPPNSYQNLQLIENWNYRQV